MRVRVAALSVAVLVTVTASLGVSSVAHADEIRDGQWYLDTFDINEIHELSQGAGVSIGVIDSGIDADHPDLEGNIKAGAEFDANGIINGDGLSDDKGHGTAVTSILAGHGHGDNGTDGIMGIAPKATIIPARANFKEGGGSSGSGAIGEALKWLVDQDVDIISISLSSAGDGPANDAIKEATDKGIAVVASTGNLHVETDWGDIEQDTTAWPANAAGVIPVSGTTQNGRYWEGSTSLNFAAIQPQLGLSAPAVDIPIALPGGKYDTVNGTSFSAPIVAGTLALIKSAYPDLDYTTWMARMLETVDDKGDKGFDDNYGWGIVNPYKALSEDVKFKDQYDTIESNASDILPLDEQDKDAGDSKPGSTAAPDGSPKSSSDSGQALTGQEDSGIPTWAIIIAAAAVLLIAAIITLVVIRRKKSGPPVPVTGQPLGSAPLAGYPPHQPSPNPYLATPQQPTPPTHPPQ